MELETSHSRETADTTSSSILMTEVRISFLRAGPLRTGSLAEQRYDLTHLSSAQISYSLLGSGLRLYLPRKSGDVQLLTIPFHSPAIAWFVPLFTRLRLLLTGPVQTGGESLR